MRHKKHTRHQEGAQDDVDRRMKHSGALIDLLTKIVVLAAALAELIHKI